MIAESALVIAFALALDFAFGDPRSRFHPTAWIGTLIASLTLLAKNRDPNIERLGGILLIVAVSTVVSGLLLLLAAGISLLLSGTVAVLASAVSGIILLKASIAVRGMECHALAVVDSLEHDGLDSARANLSMIVKRDTKNLDRNHVISGVLESISENTVDGVTGPLFYYALFGLPGAFVYRTINTADSMIGYKTDIFKNIGWFAAACDSVLNYLPSRLTGLAMVISSAILRNNWRGSYNTMIRDGGRTESLNAGYPMAALAGALGTKFEKINHYSIGSGDATLTKEHVRSAIALMKVTCIVFFGMIAIPIIAVLSLVSWWIYA